MTPPDAERWSDRLPALLVGIAALALLARVVVLGDRVAHWDEGRVGYDILRYMATGAWEYRPIVHGPFLPHVNRFVFGVAGANDFTMRLVVAVVGGLLPLSAWLYREHLRDGEVAVLALFLAADPILVYYSRFMRNDVLVAAFAFVGLGLFVRLYDTGRARYLYAGTFAWALSFTTKENALLYPVAILGALVLLLEHRLFLARDGDPPWTAVARRRIREAARGVRRFRYHLPVAFILFLAVIVLFYAPRAGGEGGIGLWAAFANPSTLPDVVAAATYNPAPCHASGAATPDPYCNGAVERVYNSWIAGGHQDHAYLPFLGSYLKVLGGASGSLVLLAVIGFVADRYRGERPRDLVSLGFYWGFVSVLGYPIAIDIRAAWAVTHAVVPFAIPAAAGAVLVYGWGRDALDADDEISVGLAALVVLLLAGQVAATTVSTSYLNPQGPDNILVQYAQPAGDMRPALRSVDRAARDNEGLDVVWYGEHYYVENEDQAYRLPIGDGEWYHRLPLPWYLERAGATVNSTSNADRLVEIVENRRPPVIVTRTKEHDDIEGRVSGYRALGYEARQFGPRFVFLIDERYAPPPDVAAGAPPSQSPTGSGA